MKTKKLYYAISLILLAAAAPVAAGPSGQALAFTCAGCHGTDGSSVGPASPHIAGLDPEYFVETMQAYQGEERNPSIMGRIARGYTDEQLESMAAYFAEQKVRLQPQQHDAAKAKMGAEIHDEYCEKCHEDGGKNSEAGILAGQWVPYLQFTWEDFMSEKREMTKKMGKKVQSMKEDHGDAGIEALINFYASQDK